MGNAVPGSRKRRHTAPPGRLTDSLRLVLPGDPQHWMRAGKDPVGRHYTNDDHRAAMERWRQLWTFSGRPRLPGGPLELDAVFYLPRPSSHYVGGKGRIVKPQALDIEPDVKPDLSNLLKLVEDALNGHAWTDDARLVRVVMEKRYAAAPNAEGGPRTEILARHRGTIGQARAAA